MKKLIFAPIVALILVLGGCSSKKTEPKKADHKNNIFVISIESRATTDLEQKTFDTITDCIDKFGAEIGLFRRKGDTPLVGHRAYLIIDSVYYEFNTIHKDTDIHKPVERIAVFGYMIRKNIKDSNFSFTYSINAQRCEPEPDRGDTSWNTKYSSKMKASYAALLESSQYLSKHKKKSITKK